MSTPKPGPAAPVGIEIAESGTRITAAFGHLASDTRVVARFPAPPAPEEAVAKISELAREALRRLSDWGMEGDAYYAEHRDEWFAGVPIKTAVAVAGRVNRGAVVSLPQAPEWADFPLGKRLTEVLGGLAQVVSETNAAAAAENWAGAGQGHLDELYVHLGRTITSAYISGAPFAQGAHGAEGLLGHMVVRADGPRCACGARGHLDPIASSQAVVRTMIGRASDREESLDTMLRVTGGRAESISAQQIVRLAEVGDPVARAVLDDALDALALALANAVALLDPGIIVLAGPLAEAGSAFLDPLAERLRAACRHLPEVPALVPAALGARAPLIGAQLLAQRLIGEQLAESSES